MGQSQRGVEEGGFEGGGVGVCGGNIAISLLKEINRPALDLLLKDQILQAKRPTYRKLHLSN